MIWAECPRTQPGITHPRAGDPTLRHSVRSLLSLVVLGSSLAALLASSGCEPSPTPTATPSPTAAPPTATPTAPTEPEINSFEDCVEAGYPVMESYPRQCRTPDGRTFVEELSPEEQKTLEAPDQICVDICGDGICQEVVCQGEGCPCAETGETCPQDCGRASDRSKHCPDYGDCMDQGPESRRCQGVGDCVASCAYGCVSRQWLSGRADCEVIWPDFECECIEGGCQRVQPAY